MTGQTVGEEPWRIFALSFIEVMPLEKRVTKTSVGAEVRRPAHYQSGCVQLRDSFSCKTSQDSRNNEAFEKELRFPSIKPLGIWVFRMFWRVGRVRREL